MAYKYWSFAKRAASQVIDQSQVVTLMLAFFPLNCAASLLQEKGWASDLCAACQVNAFMNTLAPQPPQICAQGDHRPELLYNNSWVCDEDSGYSFTMTVTCREEWVQTPGQGSRYPGDLKVCSTRGKGKGGPSLVTGNMTQLFGKLAVVQILGQRLSRLKNNKMMGSWHRKKWHRKRSRKKKGGSG